jgi:hypothetical protein
MTTPRYTSISAIGNRVTAVTCRTSASAVASLETCGRRMSGIARETLRLRASGSTPSMATNTLGVVRMAPFADGPINARHWAATYLPGASALL